MKTIKLSSSNKNSLDCFFNMNMRDRGLFEIRLELERILSDSEDIELSKALHGALDGIAKTQKYLSKIKKEVR